MVSTELLGDVINRGLWYLQKSMLPLVVSKSGGYVFNVNRYLGDPPLMKLTLLGCMDLTSMEG
jgi:hypothetical protein